MELSQDNKDNRIKQMKELAHMPDTDNILSRSSININTI